MSREAKFKHLVADVRADLLDYQQLETLLEKQFNAVLAHDAQGLATMSEAIVALTTQLEERQQVRVTLAINLLGCHNASMSAVFALLPDAARLSCERLWAQLIDNVARCKSLNVRNGQLIVAQQDVMERVLFGEKDIYVPL